MLTPRQTELIAKWRATPKAERAEAIAWLHAERIRAAAGEPADGAAPSAASLAIFILEALGDAPA